MLSNSWIIISKTTGLAICETYDPQFAEAVNREKYWVMTAYTYLVAINNAIGLTGSVRLTEGE